MFLTKFPGSFVQVRVIKTRLKAFSPRPRANPTLKGKFQFDCGKIVWNSICVNMFQPDYDAIGCNSSSLIMFQLNYEDIG